MIPYGLSLATVTTVGNSLGANKPYEAVANCRMIACVTMGITIFVALFMFSIKKPLIGLYSSNDSTDVADFAYGSFAVFLIAFIFDATQCNASGVIKATGQQCIASVCSLCCMLFVALPVGYFAAFGMDMGLSGLWIGYGASAFCLALLYAKIITQLDWCKIAGEASTTDETQYSTESTQEDDDYKRVYNTTE